MSWENGIEQKLDSFLDQEERKSNFASAKQASRELVIEERVEAFSDKRVHWFAADQKNNSPFEDPEAIQRPFGENATVYTKPVCASNRRICFPVCTFQSRTDRSAPPEAIQRPSDENATLYTSNV